MEMSQNDSFYLTLTSDSSLKDYPNNKTSSFKVSLPRTINLQGDWEIALQELHYPYTIHNVTENNDKLIFEFKITAGGKTEFNSIEVQIPIGHYRNVEDIVGILNNLVDKSFDIKTKEDFTEKTLFSLNSLTGKVVCSAWYRDLTTGKSIFKLARSLSGEVTIKPHRIYLQGTLAVLLGYNPFEHNLISELEAEHLPSVKLAISSKLLVYLNIIEHQLVGHTLVQVLKTVSTLDPAVSYGEMIEKHFPVLQYVDVMTSNFDIIEVDLRTSAGKFMPFAFGSSTLLLHLRRKRNQQEQQQ